MVRHLCNRNGIITDLQLTLILSADTIKNDILKLCKDYQANIQNLLQISK